MKEFKKTLQDISRFKQVVRIIPGRISRKQQGTSHTRVSFSYTTPAGLKLHIKKGGTTQEIFLICKKEDTTSLLKALQDTNIIT